MNIFFFDIDGVFIPSRAFHLPWQTLPLVSRFDPCVVGMVNHLAKKFDVQFVVHSSWIRAEAIVLEKTGAKDIKEHFINEGVLDFFHEDFRADWGRYDRWAGIQMWLDAHKDVENFWILEDDMCPHFRPELKKHHIHTEYETGLSFDQMLQIEHEMLKAGVPSRR